ncbi:VPS10 [Candida oxycetoniae]|uniref:VPS10 n=1 Tax=Candida oxycetoniae TaxID=497107 RepID=A0AAI9STW8_9ASCO|nr:VPS10 [Candida oxycetoniae]KAI3402982.2 VPS10 [Candida oxycetoniae]
MRWSLSQLVLLVSIFTFKLVLAYSPDVSLVLVEDVYEQLEYFDDSPTVISLRGNMVFISNDDGKSFKQVDEIKEHVESIVFDPFWKDRAFLLTMTKTHYFTTNKGKTWSKFDTELFDMSEENTFVTPPQLEFNAADANLLLIYNSRCYKQRDASSCKYKYFYTTDGFKKVSKKLPIDAHVCRFSRSSKNSEIGEKSSLFCSENKLNSFGYIVSSRLVKSKDFFKSSTELHLSNAGNGAIIDIKVTETFMTIVSRLDKYSEQSKINMFITRDGITFFKADLQIDIKYGVMSFLDSSPSSLFVQTMNFKSRKMSIAELFRSDSNGVRYKKLLDDVANGMVMKIENIDGAWLANIAVEKLDENEDEPKSFLDYFFGGSSSKSVVTKYSFDDGDTWNLLKSNDERCKIEDGCSVHLISTGELVGDRFVTGPTPGILMGVGVEGKQLKNMYRSMNTYISRDGGASWDLALESACTFSFGDQGNIIIAVPYTGAVDDEAVDFFHYSLNQGKDWETVNLEKSIYVSDILTTIDGTSRKFVITGIHQEENGDSLSVRRANYHVDFSNVYDGKICQDSDYENFYARQVGDSNSPTCVYGHKEKFKRRKQDAQCSVNKLFEDVKAIEEPCECSEVDFECSLGFMPSQKGGNKCIPDPRELAKLCLSEKELRIYDKNLINGNQCKYGSKKLEDFRTLEAIKCSDYVNPDGDSVGDEQAIQVHLNEIEGGLMQYAYVGTDDDKLADNVVLQTADSHAYISNNGGISFVKVPVHDKITGFFTGTVSGQVILVTDSDKIYVSDDGGALLTTVKVPAKFSSSVFRPVGFHATNTKKFIWLGEACSGGDCKTTGYFTSDEGTSFKKLLEDVVMCDFVGAIFKEPADNLIFCSKVAEDGKKSLWSINGSKQPEMIFDNIVGYAMTGSYVVVAVIKDGSLEAKVTGDGKTFADADFPKDLKVKEHQAYTVLDSSAGSIFMHVTTSSEDGFEYGTLLKSNSNGTYFVTSLEYVNRNKVGYVDFDRIEGLEGLIMANVVANHRNEKAPKRLQTLVSRNDGSEWDYLVPPAGGNYKCSGSSLSKCALHLHGFTERQDYRDTYSSGSAIGFLIGVGNVGEYLTDYDEASTFLSIDGGVTWSEVKKGVYMWEYGDQGTILVLVNANDETDTLLYSLNEGKSWNEYKFSDNKVRVLDLATVPTDTSRKFLIFAAHPKDIRDTLSFSIDFTNIYSRQCQLDLDNPENDDYEFWSPYHSNGEDKCLFGHESKYLRRLQERSDCFIGAAPLSQGYKQIRNCSCTRRDYECDFNYVRDPSDNTCKLVPGLTAGDRKKDMCSKPDAFQYFDSTGYRKIPLSTCQGGKQFDKWEAKACPGKEKEFNEHYGREVKGSKLFLTIFVPLLIFLSATWFVYDRGIKRNGGFQKLGSIRLDEENFDDGFNPIEETQVDVVVNKIVKGGILTAAIVIATFKTIRKVDRMLLDKIGNVIFRRSPGRRNYVSIPEEDELFGDFEDDVDEELENGARLNRHRNGEDIFRDDDIDIVQQQQQQQQQQQEEAEDNLAGGVDNPNSVNKSALSEENERLFDIDDGEEDDDEEGDDVVEDDRLGPEENQ